jgi:methionine synthase I (cobalamin-dependent)
MAAAASTTMEFIRGETDLEEYLSSVLRRRILVLDGAMGSMIQVWSFTACS